MAQKRVGVIDFNSGSQAPAFKIPIKKPITFVDLILTGALNVTVALTLREDSVLRLVKRIQMTLGGRVKKTIGDNSEYAAAARILYYANQCVLGILPQFTPPGVGVAVQTFVAALRIPVAMPKLLSRNMEGGDVFRAGTAMQPGSEDLELFVDWGTISDIFSAGTATFSTNPQLEVIVGYDESIQHAQALEWQEHTQSLGISSGAGANSDFTDDLSKFGALPYAMLMNFDNALLDSATLNRLRFTLNEQMDVLDGSFAKFQSDFKAFSGLQAAVPLGLGLALYDQELDGGGIVQANDAQVISGWKTHIDHAARTAVNRTYVHAYGLVGRV